MRWRMVAKVASRRPHHDADRWVNVMKKRAGDKHYLFFAGVNRLHMGYFIAELRPHQLFVGHIILSRSACAIAALVHAAARQI